MEGRANASHRHRAAVSGWGFHIPFIRTRKRRLGREWDDEGDVRGLRETRRRDETRRVWVVSSDRGGAGRTVTPPTAQPASPPRPVRCDQDSPLGWVIVGQFVCPRCRIFLFSFCSSPWDGVQVFDSRRRVMGMMDGAGRSFAFLLRCPRPLFLSFVLLLVPLRMTATSLIRCRCRNPRVGQDVFIEAGCRSFGLSRYPRRVWLLVRDRIDPVSCSLSFLRFR